MNTEEKQWYKEMLVNDIFWKQGRDQLFLDKKPKWYSDVLMKKILITTYIGWLIARLEYNEYKYK